MGNRNSSSAIAASATGAYGGYPFEAVRGYERLGCRGIAADSMELVTAYERYRASQRE